MKAKTLALGLLIGILPSICRGQDLLPDTVIQQLKIGIEGFKDRYHSPSIVVAIIHDKRIVFSEALGYTDLQNEIPATIESKYPILSITKMFTATMFTQLVQSGKIGFNDDISKYVPEYRGIFPESKGKGTTLLQLATHTSGLPRNSPADIGFAIKIDTWILSKTHYDTIGSASQQEFLKSLPYLQREYPRYELLSSGDRHYSKLGYALLGLGLQRAARKDYSSYVISNILEPLGMLHSGIGTYSFKNNVLAKGYYFEDSAKPFRESHLYQPNSIIYAGGIYSTASDLAKFISFQFGDTTGSEVLLPENRRMMQNFGIGWKRSYPYVLHEGSMLGFHSEIVANPSLKFGWVIMTNITNFEFDRMNGYISRLLMPIYSKKPITDLNQYVGTYELEVGYGSLKIYLRDGKLYSSYLQGRLPEQALTMKGYNKFVG